MSRYKDLLKNITADSKEIKQHINDKPVFIDGMNMFLRSFAVIPKVNNQGHHIGGLTGFLKSLGATIDVTNPSRVVVIFDGVGNITNKKNIYSDYKGTRKIKRITNWDSFGSLEEESSSIQDQLLRLIDYLRCLPITIIIIDKLEADDVIAYLAPKYKHSIIVSVDQDFLQLVSENITVYSPIRKKYYTPQDVIQEFNLPPQNFLGMKILLGDTSDNVPKVPKLGKVKLFKLFPELQGEKVVTLKEIISKSYDLCDDIPLYGNVYNFRKQLEINERLMDLKNIIIPEPDIIKINELMLQKPHKLNSSQFLNYYNADRLENSIYNITLWLRTKFEPLNIIK